MTRCRVVVLGYVVRGPLGGLAWHHLQYVLGLARLGHEVWFAEDSDDYPGCYDPSTGGIGTDPAYGLAFARDAFHRLGLPDRWAYFDAHAGRWHGPAAGTVAAGQADLLLNLSGVNPLRDWAAGIPARALVDTDPAFTQVRHLTDAAARERAARHTAFFSFGERIGQPGCTIPDDGFAWRPTRQPVVLDAWPVTAPPPDGPFTTLMQWDSYRTVEWQGQAFGMKSASFPPYLDLPRRAGVPLELAVGSPTAPRDLLRRHGWTVSDPLAPSRDPWTYQRFIARSLGEFGVAKAGYVDSRSGWFSERSAAYLASGRPVVVQDTGFTAWLHADAGVLPFGTPEEALAGIAAVRADPAGQARAAREVAAAYFDARTVLRRLVDEALG